MRSLLDNDLYKFTMMQAVWEKYPKTQVRYQFVLRRTSRSFTRESVNSMLQRIQALGDCRLSTEEIEFLTTLPYLKPEFVDFLSRYRLNPSDVHLECRDGVLDLWIEGSWVDTILWEVPLLAIVSESYFEKVERNWIHDPEAYFEKSLRKAQRLNEAGCAFIDFGTRRRRSYTMQDAVVRAFADERINCVGTSNVHFAMKYGMSPIGTMAHEWIMGHASIMDIARANRLALEAWWDVYEGQLDTALTDTYTTSLFLKDLSGSLANRYSALRHDSESPFDFTDRILAFYEKENIDSRTKAIVFSDSLNVDSAIEIEGYVAGRIKTLYGIGTHFTNDFENSPALDMVIKLFEVDGKKVAKISDNLEKASGDPAAIEETLEAIKMALGQKDDPMS